ncbi:MAG TPA: serine/threonine-protein kinase [Kofleriaceae bacterium]|nr:serine/threonine-protein kinase [Kofleriaceae bacterium]
MICAILGAGDSNGLAVMLIGDRYEVERELGKGGFGTTYAAIDRESGRRVAVKVLELHRVSDWKAVELFEREARVLRTLDHPGIPAYLEFRPLEDERQAYLVQALAPGENLEVLLTKRRFTEAELIDLARRVLAILDYLTRLHPVVVHRDIKPANILLDADGTVSLVDFGAVRDVASATMTGGSTVAGTFGYMAPEQLHGAALPCSDLYGLGMTLIHLATGRVPSDFEKKRLKPDFRAHVHFSAGFEELLDELVEPVPDDRLQTAAEVLAALDRLERTAESEPPSADRIAERRAEAERSASKKVRQPPPRRPAARKPHQRATFTSSDDAADLVIRPDRYWRGRELHFGVLVGLFPIIGAGASAAWGGTGIIATLIGSIAFIVLVWLTAPTWHLRMTTQGDFILYARNPDSPKWIGRTSRLTIETIRTQKGDQMATLTFKRSADDRKGRHFYPLSFSDASAFRQAAGWAERTAKGKDKDKGKRG